MSRLSAIFWLVVVVAAGFTTFKVKYAVQDLEDELRRVRKQTIAEQQEIRVLTAEWTYLNQPERLADLNRRFLALAPVGAKQLRPGLGDIPLRPAPEPDLAMAAAPAPSAPPPAAPAPPTAAPVAPVAPPTTPAVARATPPMPPITPAVLAAAPAHAMRVATVGGAPNPRSLDSLFAQIAEAR